MTHPIARLAAAVLAALLVALPGAALAQDETAPPSDLAAAFPDTLGGAELPVEVFEGQAWLDRADPATPDGQGVAQRTQAEGVPFLASIVEHPLTAAHPSTAQLAAALVPDTYVGESAALTDEAVLRTSPHAR